MKNNDLLLKLGNKIKLLREDMGISQEKLAQLCEFDRTYISMLERGKRNPSLINLQKLCNGLEVKISHLLEGL
jgi:putative transcriptional regulator